MDPYLELKNLSTAEIVTRFFMHARCTPYIRDLAYREDAPAEIRKFTMRRGMKRLPWEKLAWLDAECFERNEALRELLETVLTIWPASCLEGDDMHSFFASGRQYFALVTYFISMPKHIYGSSDQASIDRLRGTEHLMFLVSYLNRCFADEQNIAKWDAAFKHCYREKAIPTTLPIASLFCRYMLEAENDEPNIPAYYDKESFKLSIPLKRFLCVSGLMEIRKELWAQNLYGRAEFGNTLYNVIKTIVQNGFYREFSDRDTAYFKDALKLYLFYGILPEMRSFLQEGDEQLISLTIGAWSDLFERKETSIGEWWADEKSPYPRRFVLGIPASEIGACQAEWEEMQRRIEACQT